MVTRTLVKLYLLAYNLICCVIWGMVLIQVIKEYTESRNFAAIFNRVKEYLYFVQTLAVLEIFHSMIGIVRSPFFATLLQVFSRYFILYAICSNCSRSQSHFAFTSMVVCWAITELVRYPYYAIKILNLNIGLIKCLRYSLFIVLYPAGVASEMTLILAALSSRCYQGILVFALDYERVLNGIVMAYVPGFFILYLHMWRQRRKVLCKSKLE